VWFDIVLGSVFPFHLCGSNSKGQKGGGTLNFQRYGNRTWEKKGVRQGSNADVNREKFMKQRMQVRVGKWEERAVTAWAKSGIFHEEQQKQGKKFN